MYKVTHSAAFSKDLAKLDKKSHKLVLRVYRIIEELEVGPAYGIGKPERLKYKIEGLWSRRIDDKHRLIYFVDEEKKEIKMLYCVGHYDKLPNLTSIE